jgi:hypothetical protein
MAGASLRVIRLICVRRFNARRAERICLLALVGEHARIAYRQIGVDTLRHTSSATDAGRRRRAARHRAISVWKSVELA